jgi:hypothetical protein
MMCMGSCWMPPVSQFAKLGGNLLAEPATGLEPATRGRREAEHIRRGHVPMLQRFPLRDDGRSTERTRPCVGGRLRRAVGERRATDAEKAFPSVALFQHQCGAPASPEVAPNVLFGYWLFLSSTIRRCSSRNRGGLFFRRIDRPACLGKRARTLLTFISGFAVGAVAFARPLSS